MAKRYTEELADWVKKRDATKRQDKNVVAFLAVRGDVKDAIEAGYSIKTIWEHLRELGKIPYRYETFLKHVRKHIKDEPEVKQTTLSVSARDEKGSRQKLQQSTPKKQDKPASIGKFDFNATPNKEDLI
ncbi:TraK family protein [Hahella ganghwensis]|uniref:TraK family protein n=1 Tax=Hahella ganghwensis TaxID=286420 RepID=UPI000360B1EB|nr:TraK family protein [Hahella ganghwensis]